MTTKFPKILAAVQHHQEFKMQLAAAIAKECRNTRDCRGAAQELQNEGLDYDANTLNKLHSAAKVLGMAK